VERSNFFIEVPRILKRFRVAFVIAFLSVLMIIALSLPVIPVDWRFDVVADWAIIFPFVLPSVLHILFPVRRAPLRVSVNCLLTLAQIVLNPWLMIFSY
jgi:hypothetical protein